MEIQKWEYEIRSILPGASLEDTLDEYGDRGWELVSSERRLNSSTNNLFMELIFKRPKQSEQVEQPCDNCPNARTAQGMAEYEE